MKAEHLLRLVIPSAILLVGLSLWAGAQVVPSPGPPTGIACAYNTTPPTLTNGQAGWVQCDNAGSVIVSGGGGGSLSAKATAAAPTYVEGSTDPLSMDLSGYERVLDKNSAASLAAILSPIPDCAATPCTNKIGNVYQMSQYPVTAVPYTASATGTTAATAATLTGAASVTTYVCGFSIRANATAAATANSTLAGTISGTLNFTQWTAPLASGIGITEMIFSPCVPASAANTSIVLTSAAPGAGGVVSVSLWGYKL